MYFKTVLDWFWYEKTPKLLCKCRTLVTAFWHWAFSTCKCNKSRGIPIHLPTKCLPLESHMLLPRHNMENTKSSEKMVGRFREFYLLENIFFFQRMHSLWSIKTLSQNRKIKCNFFIRQMVELRVFLPQCALNAWQSWRMYAKVLLINFPLCYRTITYSKEP